MRSVAETPTKLNLCSVQNPIHPPSSPKPTLLEKQFAEAEANFKYCLEKGDIQRSLIWAHKRRHLHKLFAEGRNGEQHVQRIEHDDPPCERNAQEPQESGGRREDPCCRHKGAGVARLGEAHVRWSEEVRSHEDQEGSHRQQEEACARQKVSEESKEGGLRSQEGDFQTVQEGRQVNPSA